MQIGSFGFKKQTTEAPYYEFSKAGEIFDSVVHDLESPKQPEMKTGLSELDEIIGGLHRGHLTVISARPGGGKTALATQIGWELAKQNFKVFYFSLEMSKKEIITRIICNELKIDHKEIYQNLNTHKHLERIKSAQSTFDKTPIAIFDDVGYRFTDIDYVVKDFSKNKPDLVILDHVQLVDKLGFFSTNEALDHYIRKCKEYARTTKTAWLVLSQINREAEKFKGSPKLENLKGSGAIEEMADVVIIGSWDGYDGEQYKLDVAKHRHGKRGFITVRFEPKHFKFSDKIIPYDRYLNPVHSFQSGVEEEAYV